MVHLTFLEEVKDKASRLIPTPYMEIVEECTAPHLSIPIYEHVMVLCESANTKPSALGDIVRALRRRITDDSAAVKHLLVILLDAMVKNCGSPFHVELCSQKGILRDLVNLAAEPPTSARGMQAKEAALTLVLNLSIWFAGHPDPACHLLATLSNDVRAVSGPNAFEGIRPDTNTHIRVRAPASAPQSNPHAQQHQQQQRGRRDRQAGAGDRAPKDRRNYVDAILVDLPTEETIAGMLDSCMTFSEYLNNAPTTPEGDVIFDDVVDSFNYKVNKDHDYVTVLLSSNLKLDRDLLRSVSDSQTAVLARLKTQAPAAAPSVPPPEPLRGEAGARIQVLQVSHTPAAAVGEQTLAVVSPAVEHHDGFGQPAGAAPPRATVPPAAREAQPPPDIDELFGGPQPTPAAAAAAGAGDSAAPAGDHAADAAATVEPVVVPAEVPSVEAGSAPKAEPVASREEAPAPAAADDEDFDAFLDGKLNK